MTYLIDAIDVLADTCRQTAGARLVVLNGAQQRGYKGRSFAPIGQMNHHTGRGSWAGLTNFITFGSSIAPLANGMTSNPYETDGVCIVQVVACGRANHGGVGIWTPSVPQNHGNSRLWGWEHQHAGGSDPWHPLHREVILRLNVALNLAFGWSPMNVMDHKEYATPPGRKVDRAHENGNQWRALVRQRQSAGSFAAGGARPAPSPSPSPSPSPTPAPQPESEESIVASLQLVKRNQHGIVTKRVQGLLVANGHAPRNTIRRDGTVDGIFGGGTEDAVKAFQRAKGLAVDGVVGRNTWSALLGV